MLYNKYDKKSIEDFGKILENKSLRNLEIASISKMKDKGGFNKIVEADYFGIPNNNEQAPDFKEVGVELKVTPLKEVKKKESSNFLREKKGLSMKERTVLTRIDYMSLANETWETNSLRYKAFKILFCFYIWKKDISQLDFIFDLVSLWEPNKRDLEIIEQDWNTIVNKIKAGKAHEISEGDTLYLGACTKGATAEKSLTKQPFSSTQAKSRAFSFKRSYMDMVYEELLQKNHLELISIKSEHETLEETLQNIFKPFIGKTAYEIEEQLSMEVDYTKANLAKNYYSLLSNKILGVDSEKIEEFKKAGVTLKTIRIDKNGLPLESISFPKFKFLDLVAEAEWEESQLFNYLVENKFFFVVYEITTETKKQFKELSSFEQRKHLKLKKVKLWGVPSSGLDKMEELWNETRRVINEGVIIEKRGMRNFNNLPSSTFNGVGHVRPHAKDSSDTYPLPDGREMPKQCFWFNAEYIKKEIID
ncbi:Sau3AI family type II restriction endonuclease [Cetobacterium sp.]|uniref:Sau3AI family type II restriction endonuclease n=1 Tax=Cetobacterium sp. TaxID=2071632 RepID=UPI003F3E8C05